MLETLSTPAMSIDICVGIAICRLAFFDENRLSVDRLNMSSQLTKKKSHATRLYDVHTGYKTCRRLICRNVVRMQKKVVLMLKIFVIRHRGARPHNSQHVDRHCRPTKMLNVSMFTYESTCRSTKLLVYRKLIKSERFLQKKNKTKKTAKLR